MTCWPTLRNRLHVYVLPNQDLRAELQRRQQILEAFDYCSVQPGAYLHATVQQFAVTSDEVNGEQLRAFREAAARVAATTRPFTIELGAPLADDWSLGIRGTATPHWTSLVEAVRAAAAQTVNTGLPLPDAPYGPHITLGYGLADGSTERIQAASDATNAQELPALKVEAIHLVAVHQDPERGTFTWDQTASWKFELRPTELD